RTEESCEMNGVVLPPEYANIQGDIYAIKENPEDWAFLCLNEYEESESLVTIIQEANQYPMLLEILWGKRTEVEISESSFCIFAPTPEELEISQNCENPDGILFISQEALEHVSSDGLDGFANEWGNGIVYTPNSISAMIQKFTIDVSVFIHSIFG
ncbi:hypothetical protein KJ780_02570, partial [Candidatus Micrarchaeota archaeon]|nr:hypothetical protein [Candidatus Micrarchaeota archaeon]